MLVHWQSVRGYQGSMKQQSAITTNKGTNICKQYKWRRQQSSNVTYLFTTVARGAWAPGVARRLRCRSDFPWAPIINTSIPNGFIFNIKRIQYYIAQRDLYIIGYGSQNVHDTYLSSAGTSADPYMCVFNE